MIETAELAGFWAAHGIWCVSEGETLIPMLAYEQPDGERGMDRFLLDDVGESARAAQEVLDTNERDAVRAVLVADAYLNLDTGRTDALIVDAVRYGLGSIRLAVPYCPRTGSTAFAVYRPAFLEVAGVGEPDYDSLADAFFAGADSHEEAAAVWNAHLAEPA
ncbi:hypothetical protein [Amycolatopsis cihanbeyliensis]|uniref:Uncharacterized protein n=1 Tax=Amycolatopsis cihanbeyliensis TaxID=1128664 RepID=A0A542DRA1_AMYCI|nr:hypothetical protein [Amycolatopsis cihanbeyliensis]TQJ05620.1 hypothetical protein FB471_5457 [Amycolatopsis cihanbeyliensis]